MVVFVDVVDAYMIITATFCPFAAIIFVAVISCHCYCCVVLSSYG